jgi:hypothetical protein
MKRDELLDFENMRGSCGFENIQEFIKEMKPGDIYILHYRPKSDTDLDVYKYRDQIEYNI